MRGALVFTLTTEREPGIGGLITGTTIDHEQTDIQDMEMNECVQETTFALEIDPPLTRGPMEVASPFIVRS